MAQNLNETPRANRVHIAFFGMRNAGKSSVVNAVTGQEMSIVSAVKGTTTDPVTKSMELLPMGPVVIIDTPGFDDEGALGELRVKKTREILNRADCAVLVVDSLQGKTKADEELLSLFKEKEIPFLIAYNKWDLLEKNESHGGQCTAEELTEENGITVSAETSYHIQAVSYTHLLERGCGSRGSDGDPYLSCPSGFSQIRRGKTADGIRGGAGIKGRKEDDPP